ncbi:MAG: hypothetical protein JW809_15150 [Pirellulales bacterium]|nr:hypothetical protein [Pirellulales bacterium]
MSIWNKVLVGLIILASFGFVYLAMVTLKTHQYWRGTAQKFEDAIATTTDQADQLEESGLPDGLGGLRKLQVDLHKFLNERGRVWYGCVPRNMDPRTGNIVVTLSPPPVQPQPEEAGAEPGGPKPQRVIPDEGTVLYVFDADKPPANVQNRADLGVFLGEFVVIRVAGDAVEIQPSMAMTPAQMKQLVGNRGPWTLRERLPNDTRDMFAGVDRETLTRLLPPTVVDEYVNAGKDGFERKLRDYRVLIKSYDKQRAEMIEQLEQVKWHLRAIETSVADLKTQIQARQVELTSLAADLKEMSRQRDAAVAHQKALRDELAGREKRIQELLAENRAVATRIAALQTEAVRAIDQRTSVARQ